MPKTPSTKLFDLIKSLSGSEKRYFKLFVNGGMQGDKASKYIRLFDAIDGQTSFDDDQLKQLVYDGQPIQSRKYSELKAYLYDLILKSLQNYDEKNSIEFRLKNNLQSIRVLYKRGRYDDCLEMIQKSKKLAEKFEQFESLLQLLRWEKRIAYTNGDIQFMEKDRPAIEARENDILQKMENILAYKNIFYRLFTRIRQDSLLRSEEKVAKLKTISEDPLFQNVKRATSFTSQVLFYRIHSLYAFAILAYEDLYRVSKQLLELLESRPALLREDASDYIANLSNYAAACGLLEKFDEVEYCLEKFRQIKPNTQHDELRILVEYYSKKFALCIFTGDFETARQAILQHQKDFKRFGSDQLENSRFYFQYFYIYFGCADYDQALEYLNRWLNLPRSQERQDLQSLARILNLILHFERGNNLLLDYLLRSTYRFLHSRNRVYELEKLVLGFIRDSNKFVSKKELKAGFITLKKQFEKLQKIPSERVMFQYFDFISWLDSKIREVPFAEVVREKQGPGRVL